MGRVGRDQTLLGGVDLDEIYDAEGAQAKAMSQYRWYVVRTDQVMI